MYQLLYLYQQPWQPAKSVNAFNDPPQFAQVPSAGCRPEHKRAYLGPRLPAILKCQPQMELRVLETIFEETEGTRTSLSDIFGEEKNTIFVYPVPRPVGFPGDVCGEVQKSIIGSVEVL